MISMSGISLSALASRIESAPASVAAQPCAPEGQSRSFTDRSNCRRAMARHAEAAGRPIADYEVLAVAERDFRFQLAGTIVTAPPAAAPAPTADNLEIPDFCRMTKETRAAAWKDVPGRPITAPTKEMARKTAGTTKAAARKPLEGERTRYDWEGAALAAKSGTMPALPDTSASNWKPHLALLTQVHKAAKAKDIRALKALVIKPYNSLTKRTLRYRDMCVDALQAKKA